MADSKVAKARKRLKTIATGVTADGLTLEAARIGLGNAAPAELFAAGFAYAAGKPVLTIGSAGIPFAGIQHPLHVEAALVVPLAGESAQEWSNVDNLVAELRSKWVLAANYPAGETIGRRCDFEAFKVEVRGDLTLVNVALVVAFDNPDV